MKVSYAEGALDEGRAAAEFYEESQSGLGAEFAREWKAAVERLRAAPLLNREFRPNRRKCRLHRFPYALVYRLRGGRAEILAVAHLHRRPEYWERRLR